MEIDNKEIHKKKRDNPTWQVVFYFLLIVNLALGYLMLWSTDYGRHMGLGFLGFFPFIGIVGIIDFIAIISYRITEQPQGVTKVICYAALIPISLVLIYVINVIYLSYIIHR
jgi:hypothetical protein